MRRDEVDVFMNGSLFKQNAIIEYEDDDDPIDEHTPYHQGYINIRFMEFQPPGCKPVIKRSNGKKYWLSLETGTLDIEEEKSFFVLDNSYEIYHKPS